MILTRIGRQVSCGIASLLRLKLVVGTRITFLLRLLGAGSRRSLFKSPFTSSRKLRAIHSCLFGHQNASVGKLLLSHAWSRLGAWGRITIQYGRDYRFCSQVINGGNYAQYIGQHQFNQQPLPPQAEKSQARIEWAMRVSRQRNPEPAP